MRSVAVTGGIGMGKSTVGSILERWGVPMVDTDQLAHEVVKPGTPGLAAVVETFGPEVLDGEGRLDRPKVAGIVFSNHEARARLENVLHPLIRAGWKERLQKWRAAGCELGVVIIPLLFECGLENEFDRTLCVGCTAHTQQRRLLGRGMSEEELARRIRSQWPVGEKFVRADHVIWNEAGVEIIEAQLRRLPALV